MVVLGVNGAESFEFHENAEVLYTEVTEISPVDGALHICGLIILELSCVTMCMAAVGMAWVTARHVAMARKSYTSFKNVYSVGSIIVVAVIW